MALSLKQFIVSAAAGVLTLAQAGASLAMPAAPVPDAGAPIAQTRGGWHGAPGGGWHGAPGGGWARPPVARPRYPAPGWRGGYYRPGGIYGGWRRPYYGWAPGGAIAAGAAIGVLGAAAAAAYASSAAPAPGLCWYYTDATYESGFWDNCP